ncbi:MAG: YfhO family protein [Oscillospiraceae bacterium]|nr:YfhO family protein [Oscillospiraceae bacterium]
MGRSRTRTPRRPLTERREPYLLIFVISFCILFLMILPVMVLAKGYFVYYGDFNAQQLPFYYLSHENVQNGSFGWDWKTDLGSNFIGSYSFYLLGSPFFWLTVPFPQSWVLYMMPYLLALKHAVAALTSYAYIRRFVRSREASMIGALLYAFSGFQLYNIFFNHFQDVTAFFPLLLIAMEQRINEERRGVFALTVAFMAILNYYFFTGQAVFVVLYFIMRCTSKDFHADVRKFFSIALEAVIGVMIASFMLLPSAFAIMDNQRTQTHLYGNDMIAYSDTTRIWHILQSFFMLPDVPARPNLFRTNFGKWSSIGGYLPMFSMAGVIAFMSQKKKHWATRLTAVCMVCALIPVLNSAFYMLNGSYYARWYYMPILIMAFMTAYALDNPQIKWKSGFLTCGLFLAGFAVIALLPRKENETVIWFDFAKYTWYHWIALGMCAVMLCFGILAVHLRRQGRSFYRPVLAMTVICCLASGAGMLYFGLLLSKYPLEYVNTAILGGKEITLEESENQFYRVDISKDYDNYPMFWGYSNMRCFHSIVPVSVMEFYDALDIDRDVASRAGTENAPIRELLSVRYYFDKVDSKKGAELSSPLTQDSTLKNMPAFHYLKTENGFHIYENEAYIPMGFTYDYAFDAEQLEALTPVTRQQLMCKALVMSRAQMEQYADILEPLPNTERIHMSDAQLIAYCKERSQNACDTFQYDSYGFQAAITTEKPQMVFFSVPYESGWTASVNGKPTEIERVNVGFMAVRCEEGDNVITFHYETPGLRSGAVASVCGVFALILYLVWMGIGKKQAVSKYAKHKYYYDYASVCPMAEHMNYISYALLKNNEAHNEKMQSRKQKRREKS